jgi:hypothetical protein
MAAYAFDFAIFERKFQSATCLTKRANAVGSGFFGRTYRFFGRIYHGELPSSRSREAAVCALASRLGQARLLQGKDFDCGCKQALYGSRRRNATERRTMSRVLAEVKSAEQKMICRSTSGADIKRFDGPYYLF